MFLFSRADYKWKLIVFVSVGELHNLSMHVIYLPFYLKIKIFTQLFKYVTHITFLFFNVLSTNRFNLYSGNYLKYLKLADM